MLNRTHVRSAYLAIQVPWVRNLQYSSDSASREGLLEVIDDGS